jgi:mRNA interferase RelE/StbE
MYQVKVAEEAARFIRKQDKRIQRQIINNIRELAQNPRPQGCKKLQGYKELYRIPSGNYRIVYTIREKMLLVFVVRVAHRKDIYRHLRG